MNIFASAALRVLLTTIGLVGSFIPRSFELWAGPILGRLICTLGLFKVRTARENIGNCFPELSETERETLLKKNYEHYGILFFEFLHFFSPISGHYRRYMQSISVVEGLENWKTAHDKGKGVLFVASHVGFWEALAAGGAMAGIPLTVVTTILKPAWLNDKITAQRTSTEVKAVYHPGAGKPVLRELRKGRSVAFMNDQYASAPMGMPVEFFGVRVETLSAVGPLARRTGAAVVPVGTYRDENGISHVVISPELDLGEAIEDTEAATQILAKGVEDWVRTYPEQWLWIHRRFKRVEWPKAASN